MHATTDALPPSQAAGQLIAAHPHLSVASVDVADVPGLGPTALIQVADLPALRAWARALHITARSTGASAYGSDDPHHIPGLPEWMWWRLTYLDTTVADCPVRLWTLDTTEHPRATAVFLAASAHTPKEPVR
ncbi:hypothetical protein [Streptomyces sp. RG80]|uniref:hypothetical protein n=1 Tax=Streptomyces sp. RG80 TaxID=3157340 RepID=UPI00338FAB9D